MTSSVIDYINIIDSHFHLWTTTQFDRPWLSGALARDFTREDYEAATKGISLEAAIYVESGVTAEYRYEESQWILEAQQKDAIIAGAVISIDPLHEDYRDVIATFSSHSGLKGVRPAIHRQVGTSPLLNEPFLQLAKNLGEANLCCDLLIGRDELQEAAILARQRPDTRFILDHCGAPGRESKDRALWEMALAVLAQCPNVYCKVSGIVGSSPTGIPSAETLEPIVRHCAEAFGEDRLLFGSDWPVCTLYASLTEWKGILDEIIADWSEAEKRNLFHDNAALIYRL